MSQIFKNISIANRKQVIEFSDVDIAEIQKKKAIELVKKYCANNIGKGKIISIITVLANRIETLDIENKYLNNIIKNLSNKKMEE